MIKPKDPEEQSAWDAFAAATAPVGDSVFNLELLGRLLEGRRARMGDERQKIVAFMRAAEGSAMSTISSVAYWDLKHLTDDIEKGAHKDQPLDGAPTSDAETEDTGRMQLQNASERQAWVAFVAGCLVFSRETDHTSDEIMRRADSMLRTRRNLTGTERQRVAAYIREAARRKRGGQDADAICALLMQLAHDIRRGAFKAQAGAAGTP